MPDGSRLEHLSQNPFMGPGEISLADVLAKLDVDDSPNVAMKYGVRSIPALIFFKEGKPVDQIVGAVPKGALKKKIDAVIGS